MKTFQNIDLIQPSQKPDPVYSFAVQEFLTLAEKQAWTFSVLGQAPMPNQPVRLKDWLIIPAEQDTSQIPVRSMERIQTIFAAGIHPKGFVVVHEAPMLLPAPPEEKRKLFEDVDWEQVRRTVSESLLTSAKILGTAVLGLVGAVFSTLFLGLAALDPILIVVTEDNYWIEIDRWYT